MSHPDHAPSSDLTWHDQFRALPFSQIASNEWYAADTPAERDQRKDAKANYLADETLRTPAIAYDKLRDEHVFDETERAYQALLNDAPDDPAYEKAARRLAELYRHKEIIRGLGRTGVRQILSQERAAAMSAELFGEPDKDTFLALIATLRTQAEGVAEELPEATELLDLLGSATPEGNVRSPELTLETLRLLHDDLRQLYPGIDEAMAIEGDLSETAGSELTRRYIDHLLDFFDLRSKGWQVEIIPGSAAAASTDSNRKVITLGEDRTNFSKAQLKKTSIHEVMGHALRAEGQVSMASLKFEEGFAVALEQITSEERREGSGEQYYTSLGLQYGLDRNGVRRDHRETFEIMWRRNLVQAYAKGAPVSVEKARESAYTTVYRTRRGDAIDTRDISYFEGARIAPEWINSIRDLPSDQRQQALTWVLSGRFDPTNPDHVAHHPQTADA